MELAQLRAVVALADLSSFARAAERLHLSSPAVFNQIRQLEERLGGRLYERIGRRLVLTPKGKLLAEHATRIVSAHDLAVEELTECATPRREVLRIGAGPHSGVHIVPHLLRAYLAAHPDAELRFSANDDQSLLRDLRDGALDAVLLTLPAGDPQLEEQLLWTYEMAFVLPPRKFKEWHFGKDLAALSDKPFILYHRQVVVDQAIRRICLGAGYAPRVVMESDNPDSIAELVKLGIGYAILPMWTVAEDVNRRELSIIACPQRAIYQFGMLYRPECATTRTCAGLRRVAAEWRDWWPLARFVEPFEALRNAG
jgi:DNA-binding transcriptional LysR family regulator